MRAYARSEGRTWRRSLHTPPAQAQRPPRLLRQAVLVPCAGLGNGRQRCAGAGMCGRSRCQHDAGLLGGAYCAAPRHAAWLAAQQHLQSAQQQCLMSCMQGLTYRNDCAMMQMSLLQHSAKALLPLHCKTQQLRSKDIQTMLSLLGGCSHSSVAFHNVLTIEGHTATQCAAHSALTLTLYPPSSASTTREHSRIRLDVMNPATPDITPNPSLCKCEML